MSLVVAYIGNHDQVSSNDDEGAITHALLALGHDVSRLREIAGNKAHRLRGDFLLFHKWSDVVNLQRADMPRVFYYFDLVNFPDPSLAARNQQRLRWMEQTLPHVGLGFMTDGDFVAQDKTGKLMYLPQGADERMAGRGAVDGPPFPLLLTAFYKGGKQRESFIDEMKQTYGNRLHHVQKGVYGRPLANLIARAAIVLAPDGPVTPRYWSNRVYNALGFGAFLLHPYCEELAKQYRDGEDLVLYRSRQDLHEKIRYYLERPKERERIAANGLKTTMERHLYRHRVAELVRIVKERLL